MPTNYQHFYSATLSEYEETWSVSQHNNQY